MQQQKSMPMIPVALSNGSLDGRDVGVLWPIDPRSGKEEGQGAHRANLGSGSGGRSRPGGLRF